MLNLASVLHDVVIFSSRYAHPEPDNLHFDNFNVICLIAWASDLGCVSISSFSAI